MAAPTYANTDTSVSVVTTDATYLGGLDLEAQIITTVEQDQRSPYAKKGIAVTDTYLKIRTKPSKDAEVVGKLYTGSGCEIVEISDGWAHITSGECEGYVKAKYLLTGTDAEAYAAENNISEIIAKSQDQELYLYEAPSADSKIVATVLADQELTVLGSSEDERWAQVSLGEKTGYVPADSIVLDVKYEEAVSLEAENNDKAAETETEAETEPETESEEKESVETEKETEAETEATETEKTEVSVEEVNETVWAAYSVSIRAEASVDAEKLGVLIGSESITRTGICDNGWSRVDYNGTTAYIKSEYLTTNQPAVTETEKTAEPEEVKETVYATAGVNVRAKASADSDIIGTVIAGYSITRTSNKDGWSKVDYNGTTGYIKSDYLTTTKPQVSESTEKTSTSTQTSSIEEVNETVYATDGVNIRAKASADAQKLGSLAAGSSITRTGKLSNGWSRVEFSGTTGYIKSDYLTTEKPSVTTTTTSSSSSLGQQIADFAVQYVGYPYVYGGNSLTNGVDCSGFTQQVYLHFGYSIPRRASIQGTVGTSVAISDLQPGDLVFYGDSTGIGHVVIYIGNGQVVHASTPSKGIIISDLYYRTPMCARRII
jgi:uncharacterized protein YgiM (DUF1202 family)